MMCPFFMLFPAVEIYLVLINNYFNYQTDILDLYLWCYK